jgi:NIPSNAP
MIYELRTYRLKVGALAEFLGVLGELVPHLERNGGSPFGVWYTDVGTLNEVTQLYGWNDFAHRTEVNARWKADADPQKAALQLRARGLMVKQEAKLLQPAPFSRMM